MSFKISKKILLYAIAFFVALNLFFIPYQKYKLGTLNGNVKWSIPLDFDRTYRQKDNIEKGILVSDGIYIIDESNTITIYGKYTGKPIRRYFFFLRGKKSKNLIGDFIYDESSIGAEKDYEPFPQKNGAYVIDKKRLSILGNDMKVKHEIKNFRSAEFINQWFLILAGSSKDLYHSSNKKKYKIDNSIYINSTEKLKEYFINNDSLSIDSLIYFPNTNVLIDFSFGTQQVSFGNFHLTNYGFGFVEIIEQRRNRFSCKKITKESKAELLWEIDLDDSNYDKSKTYSFVTQSSNYFILKEMNASGGAGLNNSRFICVEKKSNEIIKNFYTLESNNLKPLLKGDNLCFFTRTGFYSFELHVLNTKTLKDRIYEVDEHWAPRWLKEYRGKLYCYLLDTRYNMANFHDLDVVTDYVYALSIELD